MPTIKDGDMSVSPDWDSVTDYTGDGTLHTTSTPEGGSGYNGAGCFEAKQTCTANGTCTDCSNHPYKEYTKSFSDGLSELRLRARAAGKGGGSYCPYALIQWNVYDASDTMIGAGELFSSGSNNTEPWQDVDKTITDSDLMYGHTLSEVRKIKIKCGLSHVVS